MFHVDLEFAQSKNSHLLHNPRIEQVSIIVCTIKKEFYNLFMKNPMLVKTPDLLRT